jgi:hypothetical protein
MKPIERGYEILDQKSLLKLRNKDLKMEKHDLKAWKQD